MAVETIKWVNGRIRLIDQTQLPDKFEYIYCDDIRTLWKAIKVLSVRGAPAIGVAAAFGVVLAANNSTTKNVKTLTRQVRKACGYLSTSRPTAVNLFYALARMEKVLDRDDLHSVEDIKKALKAEAMAMFREDQTVCRNMGRVGAKLIKNNSAIMTICNAGALATADYGTALGVMYAAQEQGKEFKVYACETRPLLQGARLTAWELHKSGIDTTLICDSMAATLMKQGRISAVFTGADRIASNGDTANKIGTYNLAVLCKHHRIPFYVVAPISTFDMSIRDGSEIPIEERGRDEVAGFRDVQTAPRGVPVYNPAFDVTEAKLITGIVTENGLIAGPSKTRVKKIVNAS